ncbi:MAG: oxaloacetate decarboxylase [Dehalococcoidia bacterium]
MPQSIEERRAAFRKLHESGCFLIPNPYDIGTARYLAGMGFKALATTSSGSAYPLGKPDGGLSVEQVLEHIRTIVDATDLPVNADFEHGYAEDEDGLAANVKACVATGVAGLSIEDSTGVNDHPLFDFDEAVQRMKVTRKAIDETGANVMLIGRAEGFIAGHPDLDDVLQRLQAYSEAGADCLYAPGLTTREQIEAVVQAAAPKPVNVLIGRPIGFSLDDLASMGVRRVSVGGALAAAAWGGFIRAAEALKTGSFDGFAQNANGRELGAFFRTYAE